MALSKDPKLEFTTESQEDVAIGEDGIDLQEKDVALGLLGEHAHTFDHVDEIKVLRKIDWFFYRR